jgi:AsmA protein
MKALKVAAVTLLAVIAAGAVLMFVGIPAGFLLKPIQDRIAAGTGYQIKVSGPATLKILPAPTIVLSGISLRDLASTAAEPVIAAQTIRASASLQSLFGNRPQITEVIMTAPVVRAPLIRQRSATAPKSASSKAAAAPVPEFTVDHFAVHGGTVLFVTAANNVESRLDNVELVGSLAENGQLDAIVSAQSGEQALRVTFKGTAPKGGFDGRPLQLDFSFEAPGLLQGALAGSTEIRATGSLIRFNNINGSVAANKFSGWASADVSDKPLVKVELDFQKLDIGAARAAGSGSGSTAPGGLNQPWSNTPINLEGLNYVDAEIQLSAAVFNVGSFHFAPIAVNATLNNGIVRAAFSQMGIYGGQATGGIAADVTRADHSYALAMNIVGMRALPLLTDVANFTSVDGAMQVNIDLRAWGQNERAIMSSLDGTLSFLVQDGAIRNVNIAQMIRNVGSTILNGWQSGTSEKTDFTQFGGGFRFQNGQATTNNLQLAGPLVRVTGAGTADIGAKTLQFKLEPKLVMSLEGQGGANAPAGLGVPVMVQGTWAQPKIYPEFAGMLDNPDAAFAKLKELGLGLIGGGAAPQSGGGSSAGGTEASGTGNPSDAGGAGALIQGIGDVLKNLGTNPASSAPSTSRPSTAPAAR